MRKRLLVLCAAIAVAAASLIATAPSADARKLIGCDSLLNWPCPGPVP